MLHDRLPDNVSFEQAALAEPLSVLLHASRRAGLVPSLAREDLPESIVVLGAGAIGLLACAVARTYGVPTVCAIDINQARLDFALQHGFADRVFCLPAPAPADKEKDRPKPGADEQMRRAREAADGALKHFALPEGAALVYECTGAEPCVQQAVFLAATGAKVLLIGMGTRVAALPLSAAATREVDVLGSFRYADTYPEALAMLAAEGSFVRETIGALVSHRFGLADARRAFELLARGRDEKGGMVLKVVVGPEAGDAQR
jgi:L-iditol 2-dehydrogenase